MLVHFLEYFDFYSLLIDLHIFLNFFATEPFLLLMSKSRSSDFRLVWFIKLITSLTPLQY
jgi:hypothetical protein